MVKQQYDYLIIGAGIAGASLAYRLAGQASVLVIEREAHAGYHSTGRSAAMFMESYGTPTIQALTRASRTFLETPPENFCDHDLIKDRGVLYIAYEGQEALLEESLAEMLACGAHVNRVAASYVLEKAPCVKAQGLIGAIEEPDAKDIDVDALHQGFLKGARQGGVDILFNATVANAERQGNEWVVVLSSGESVTATSVVNAAGAWGDVVAPCFGARPVGLQPKRRSAFTFKVDGYPDMEHWPAVVGVEGGFYFKPDAGQLLGSPANEDEVQPHDVVPEELDIAIGIDRIQSATTMQIRRPSHVWAGLRSFVPDGEFVIGWDADTPGFFWLIGQGGYGIQTCVAASLLAKNLVVHEALDPSLDAVQIQPAIVSPGRLRSTRIA